MTRGSRASGRAGVRRSCRKFCPDGFVLSLVAVVLTATFAPCDGLAADVFHVVGTFAIASLFFLQGARLSRDAILNGITHWRLHLTIGSLTFAMFPAIGLASFALFPQALSSPLWLGVLFVCALPSTVQSSIALTSIAHGNVAGAVCSATASNLLGIVLSPVIFAAMSHAHGNAIDAAGIRSVILELLLPFMAGHASRSWIGRWAECNRALLSITDRGSILVVVYAAFSAAVVHGVWRLLPPAMMAVLGALVVILLSAVLLIAVFGSRALGFNQADEVALVFCGTQKSLVSGVPIANALFPASMVGPVLIPLMLYYPLQLLVCAWLARRYAARSALRGDEGSGRRQEKAPAIPAAGEARGRTPGLPQPSLLAPRPPLASLSPGPIANPIGLGDSL